MSAWREEASNRLPEIQSIIASRDVESPMMLWIELQIKFQSLCKQNPPPIDLIQRMWDYALWCMTKGNEDVRTAAALGLCEHLIDTKASRQMLPKIMERKLFEGFKDLLLYHNSEEEYEVALKLFKPVKTK